MEYHVLELLPEPPFVIGTPGRIPFLTRQDAIKFINMMNGKVRLYVGLYGCIYPSIDRIWFDLDSDKAFDNIIIMHNYCIENNYKHVINFSGGGFHFIIFTKNYNKLEDDKAALRAAHIDIITTLKFTFGLDNKNTDIDGHIIGDIQRIYSFPGTYNTKRKKWVTSLNQEDLDKGLEHIKNIASKQSNKLYYFCDDYFDMSKFNKVQFKNINITLPINTDTITIDDNDSELKQFPSCVQKILLNINNIGTWKGRYLFTVWAKELMISKRDCNNIAKKYFSRVKRYDKFGTNYGHYKQVNALDYVYERDDVLPTCAKVYSEYGCCDGKCKWYMDKKE